MYENLSDFLGELEDDGDLVRITTEVDADLELAAVTHSVSQQPGGGPALLFENASGQSVPVVTNLLGSDRRMKKALRIDSFDALAERIAGLLAPNLPEGMLERLKLIPHFAELAKLPPKTVNTGISQQIVHMGSDVDLGRLPFPRNWPAESHPTITLGQVATQDPEQGLRDVELVPLEVTSSNSLLVHWGPHDDGWQNFLAYRQAEQQMPVAIAFGGDPVCAYMAHAPLPAGVDECLLGGFLRGQPLELVACRSIELEVPAQAEIVLEGTIDTTAELTPAGRIATPAGLYSGEHAVPALQVTALTQRSNPLLPVMVPPAEAFWYHVADERLLLPFVKLFLPEVCDWHMPACGAFRNLLFVSIRKTFPGQARKVMHALWSLGATMVTKMIVVLDADVEVHNEQQVWFCVGANTHPGRDVAFCEGPTHLTDQAAPVPGMGHKMGIDATRKLPAEGHPRDWPQPDQLATNNEIQDRLRRRWKEYGLAGIGEPEPSS